MAPCPAVAAADAKKNPRSSRGSLTRFGYTDTVPSTRELLVRLLFESPGRVAGNNRPKEGRALRGFFYFFFVLPFVVFLVALAAFLRGRPACGGLAFLSATSFSTSLRLKSRWPSADLMKGNRPCLLKRRIWSTPTPTNCAALEVFNRSSGLGFTMYIFKIG